MAKPVVTKKPTTTCANRYGKEGLKITESQSVGKN
jgi:hypothetical protein